MFKQKNIQYFMASFLSGLYIFVVIFSGTLHQHSDSILSNVKQKGEKNIHISTEISSSSKDCLVCHFNTTNFFQLPDVVEVKTPFLQDFHPHAIASVFSEVKSYKALSTLRGPPSYFN